MDPDANLAEQRRLAAKLSDAFDKATVSDAIWHRMISNGDVERLVELVGALDVWLRTGGALPEAWAVR